MSLRERLHAWTRADGGAWFVAILFVAISLPWLGSIAHYHGDERFYTDAAMRMLARHDWIRPVYADGELRLNKPLFSYWVLIPAYAGMGVSLLISRLPFLISGALVVALTGRLARTLFPGEWRVALLASAIVAGDVALSTIARRSTPDSFVALFATASLYGLARIVVANERGTAPRAWFWIGAGLSVATKGGWGLLTVVFGFATMIALRKQQRSPRELVHWTSMLVALAIGTSGLAGLFVADGSAEGASLFQDQVGSRLAADPSEVLAQAGNYAGSVFKHLLPWTALLLIGLLVAPNVIKDAWRTHRRSFGLAFGWFALLFVVFSLSNTHRGRYIVPAHPIMACACAALLHNLSTGARSGSILRGSARALTTTLAVVLTVFAIALVRIDARSALSIAACAIVAWIAFAYARRARELGWLVALAVILSTVAPLGSEPLRALVDPSPVPNAVARLRSLGFDSSTPVAVLGFFATTGSPSTASQMRVMSGGTLDPVERVAPRSTADVADLRAVLAVDAARPVLESAGFQLELCSRSAPSLSGADAWQLLTSPDPSAWLAARGAPLWIGVRPPDAAPH